MGRFGRIVAGVETPTEALEVMREATTAVRT